MGRVAEVLGDAALLQGKSEYCLRWRLLKTGGESKDSCSTVLRTFIRGML